jgi:hypothetical protein
VRTARAEVRAAPKGAPDSEQDLSGAPLDCPVHHRTVRWPSCQNLQQSNPNGWVTWLAHRTVSSGAPDGPVRPSTAAIPNGHFGGWGYKYPQPPHFKTSKFSAIAFNTRALDFTPRHKSKDQILSQVRNHSNQLVTSERDIRVHLSSGAWIAFLLPHFLFPIHL